jgi:hypothetical protein
MPECNPPELLPSMEQMIRMRLVDLSSMYLDKLFSRVHSPRVTAALLAKYDEHLAYAFEETWL